MLTSLVDGDAEKALPAAFDLTERASLPPPLLFSLSASSVSKTNKKTSHKSLREALHMNCHINNTALVFKFSVEKAKERLNAPPSRGQRLKTCLIDIVKSLWKYMNSQTWRAAVQLHSQHFC